MTTFTTAVRLRSTHRLNRRSLVALASGAMTLSAGTEVLPVAAQGTPAASTVRVDDLDAILASGVEQGLPGSALAIAHGNAPVYSGASGVASIEGQKPLETADRFRIYSITKTFTAIVVLHLIDEGTLTLDDTVAQWLDDAAVGRIPPVDTMTVSQLLRHTSGIYDFADDDDSPFWEDAFLGPDADWSRVWTIEELLGYADGANHAPYFAPGQGSHYANTNYILLGMIVEEATGRSFREELQSRILDALSLADTSLAEGSVMPDGIADGYQVLGDELMNVSDSNLSWIWTAGGIVSTTTDVLRFAQAVFSGQLLSEASFAEMLTFLPSGRPGMEWGVGVYRIDTPNGPAVGMDGGSAGFSSSMMRFEEGDVTVVTLVNLAPDEGMSDAVRDEAVALVLANLPDTRA